MGTGSTLRAADVYGASNFGSNTPSTTGSASGSVSEPVDNGQNPAHTLVVMLALFGVLHYAIGKWG